MITTLKKQGNSRSVIFPPAILQLLKINDETSLELSTDGTSITLTPVQDKNKHVIDSAEEVLHQFKPVFKRLADR